MQRRAVLQAEPSPRAPVSKRDQPPSPAGFSPANVASGFAFSKNVIVNGLKRQNVQQSPLHRMSKAPYHEVLKQEVARQLGSSTPTNKNLFLNKVIETENVQHQQPGNTPTNAMMPKKLETEKPATPLRKPATPMQMSTTANIQAAAMENKQASSTPMDISSSSAPPPPPPVSMTAPSKAVKTSKASKAAKLAGCDDDDGPGGGRWSREEDMKLRQGVQAIGPTKWKRISEEFLGGKRSDVQCLHRWQKVLRPGLVKGPWTEEEDNIIRGCIARKVTKWSEIAERIPGRIGKQCRERWFNHLDPNIDHSAWTEEEEKVLVTAQAKFGNRWCEIAKLLPGRPENAVKNRWNSAIRRKWQLKLGLPVTDNKGKPVDPQPAKNPNPGPLPALVPVVKTRSGGLASTGANTGATLPSTQPVSTSGLGIKTGDAIPLMQHVPVPVSVDGVIMVSHQPTGKPAAKSAAKKGKPRAVAQRKKPAKATTAGETKAKRQPKKKQGKAGDAGHVSNLQHQHQLHQAQQQQFAGLGGPLDFNFYSSNGFGAQSPSGPFNWDLGLDQGFDLNGSDFLGLDAELLLGGNKSSSSRPTIQTGYPHNNMFFLQQQQQQSQHANQNQFNMFQRNLMMTPGGAFNRMQAKGSNGGLSPIGPMANWDGLQPEVLDRNMASLTLSMLDNDFDLGVQLPGPKTDDSLGVNWNQHGLSSPFSPTNAGSHN